ncbi:MAG: hypothetical protein RLY93_03140 [Sumerlaeia bacterium]
MRFEPHAAYQSNYGPYDKPLVIIVPDDRDEAFTTLRTGSQFLDPKSFQVFYIEALAVESHARFRNMFAQVAVVEQSEFLRANDLPLLNPNAPEPEPAEEESPVPGEGSEPEFPLPDFVTGDRGYVLEFRNVLFGFGGNRPRYSTEVIFVDREADELLLAGRLEATGRELSPSNNKDFIEERVRASTVTACSQLLVETRRKMAEAIEKGPASK